MDTISFAGEGIAPDLLPLEELADCAAEALAADGVRILSYGSGAGYTPLRELLAERFGVHPYRVVLTNGWLQGLALVAQGLVAGRGAVSEYPTYNRALRVLFACGARLIYSNFTPEGINLDDLDSKLRQTARPALAYLMPTFQNPTGRTMPLEQRLRLLGMRMLEQTVVVEDDTYGALRYDGEAVSTLFELSQGQTVYSTSFSAVVAPGLRVGAWVVPDALAAELAARATDSYITPALQSQAAVYEFIRRGSLEGHLERLRRELARRRDAIVRALERHLPAASWTRPDGGINVLVELPLGTNAEARLAEAVGVSAIAGTALGGWPNMVRLGYGELSPDEIEIGVERLAAALGAGDPNPREG